MSSISKSPQLKLRVFAGPNGSGKSTVIKSVREYKVKEVPIDFGAYINADDIAKLLRESNFSFNQFEIIVTKEEFEKIALASGLVNSNFDKLTFRDSFTITENSFIVLNTVFIENLAQILADYLRKKLLKEKERFSFETVFSHKSKLVIMQEAKELGYKVYLYFVSTESPDINIARVASRVAQGGHDVPEDKIVSRYNRSLDFLYEACQIADQVYFFDNSTDGSDSNMFAHFKKTKGEKQWDIENQEKVPNWFRQYYSQKVKKQ